jgi:hypothetical protein
MQSYEDFLLISQICIEEAGCSRDEATAVKLRSLAKRYHQRAVQSLNSPCATAASSSNVRIQRSVNGD